MPVRHTDMAPHFSVRCAYTTCINDVRYYTFCMRCTRTLMRTLHRLARHFTSYVGYTHACAHTYTRERVTASQGANKVKKSRSDMRHRSTCTSGRGALPLGTVGPGPSQGSRQLRGTGRQHVTPTSCVGYMHTRVSWSRQVKYACQADIAALAL